MRKKLPPPFSTLAIVVGVIVTGYFATMIVGMSTSGSTSGYSESISLPADAGSDTAFGGIFMFYPIDSNLPHRIYQQKADSITAIKNRIEQRNKSYGTSISIKGIGVTTVSDKDMWPLQDSSLQKRNDPPPGSYETDRFYMTLKGYTLDHHTRFYMSGGHYFLAVVKWDTSSQGKYDSHRTGHYERKWIPVRYSEPMKEIMVPIPKSWYRVLYICMHIIPILFIFFEVYIAIGLPLQLMLNISRGKAFTKKNIRILRFIAVSLFMLAMISITLPYILYCIYYNLIPAEFRLQSIIESVVDHLYMLFASLIAFMFSLAFRKGCKLQQEQDLTI